MIPRFLKMHDFNQRATQHEKDHPKFPGVKSCWDVPQVQELTAKYEVDHSVINIVEDRLKLDERGEAHLIALACSEAPQGHDHWTLRLLASKVVELGIVPSVSHEGIRKRLKKTVSSRGRKRSGVFPR